MNKVLVLLFATTTRGQGLSAPTPPTTKGQNPILITIHGKTVDVTAYAAAHPGGSAVLRKYHMKDATRAFEGAKHSKGAYKLLGSLTEDDVPLTEGSTKFGKLFTKEDRSQIHKVLGVACLLHFMYRYGRGVTTGTMGFVGPAAALWFGMHGALSLSSFKFHVPMEKTKGRPVIWAEYRVHNAAFALRGLICAWLAANGKGTTAPFVVLGTFLIADLATTYLRKDGTTTQTMPYWDGASIETTARFKLFYAYCQFMASLACLAAYDPGWCFITVLPIQLASFLLTLVRKSILSTRGLHLIYAASLALPFAVHPVSLLPFLPVAALLLSLRKAGVSKYALWGPLLLGRLFLGDNIHLLFPFFPL